MVRWPYSESSPLRDVMESLVHEERRRRGSRRGEPMPVNVYEEPGALVIEALLPGVEPDAVEIQGGDGVLTIRAQAKVADRAYVHQEIYPVEWLRRLGVPADARLHDAEARSENGVLTIRIPKEEPKAPEKIRIQVARRDAGGRPPSKKASSAG